MMREQKFFICRKCGNLVGLLNESGVPMICCGQEMEQLIPNTVDASAEKHVPDVTCDGARVEIRVGSAAHPMTEEHYIEWIYLHTQDNGYRRRLHPGAEPTATFLLEQTGPMTVYAYCNLHGLWKWESGKE